ncbi:AbrB/MazE/SpoVT family DNA-binding domain-containing protein [Natrarchaeobius oligotrophus]|uniref:AbrB/MazE/SpoVT family DNA-binding domain-containing protein n=1 Tax=Natrarchaeobius chitinivorans TaxID=1679083 RepID=A0A3N6MDL9_NATCH|nr:AbrB/MazE/SpoVT family DNA-binding domain-containing protein [Natrarchaeobius chitinivorans]RQG98864.1 AbrB/MazE/SpoVT family DNA-binding domain-containing protein [Natrarchaeobius chitinivorans]
MPTVDSKGRIVLPKEVREQLGLDVGTEVDVREKDGKAVVEPETDPERIIERMESLVERASPDPTSRREDDLDAYARDHAETIRRRARRADDE